MELFTAHTITDNRHVTIKPFLISVKEIVFKEEIAFVMEAKKSY